jgi:signal transduction histidine kinase
MLLAALLLPLAHTTTTAALFPYAAASAAGGRLASRRAAVSIAVTGAVVAAGATWLVGQLDPNPWQWPWWVPLTVALPVYIGISNRDRREALYSARRAAEEAQRARESEAREAALIERGRIAREIHDVLGHSLSGIAMQLDMADALRDSGRDEEATAAVRRARALAVDSINETRNAVHALREDTLSVPDALRQLAEHNAVDFEITGEVATVGAESAHTIVRAAQEALTNAAKYAPGAERSMRLAFTTDRVMLAVRNGRATEAPRSDLAGGTGVGLVGMRERAALLGGTLQAEPSQEGGWSVELELPR